MTFKWLAWMMAAVLTIGGMQAEPLRVMTYNLRYITGGDTGAKDWKSRRDPTAELIKADQPDLIGIQEGLPQMMNDLTDRLAGYAVIGVGREDGIDRGEYAAILVKTERFRIQESGTFWLSETPEIPNSCSWGNTVTRICTWAKLYDRHTRKTLHFYNTHLDHAAPLARQKGTELILSRMAARTAAGPVIFTGDFNAPPADPLHTAIKTAGLTDSWLALHADVPASESGTYHDFTGATNRSRIDFLYVSAGLKVLETEILRTAKDGHYPSDHFPVRATLEWAPQP
jgi:endonuclease/exonuclease/phosphatase family metal-dependent hydrolase